MIAAAVVLCLLQAPAPSSPAPAPSPGLPEGNAFVRGLVGAQKRNEAAIDRYTYDLLEVREELDGKGAVKERKSRLSQVFHVKGRPVKKLVAEDDQPLSAARQAREDKEVSKRVEAIVKGESVSERPGLRLSVVMERFDFRSVAREDVNGRTALALDFAPRPGKRDLDSDNVLRRLSGRIWVDEAEREVVKAHLRSTGAVKFALGIGGALSTFDAVMEFRKLEDGVWLPRESRVEFSGRKLFKSFRTRLTTVYDRYRRFEVQSEEQLRPGP
jgi:hypothetical protein